MGDVVHRCPNKTSSSFMYGNKRSTQGHADVSVPKEPALSHDASVDDHVGYDYVAMMIHQLNYNNSWFRLDPERTTNYLCSTPAHLHRNLYKKKKTQNCIRTSSVTFQEPGASLL